MGTPTEEEKTSIDRHLLPVVMLVLESRYKNKFEGGGNPIVPDKRKK